MEKYSQMGRQKDKLTVRWQDRQTDKRTVDGQTDEGTDK